MMVWHNKRRRWWPAIAFARDPVAVNVGAVALMVFGLFYATGATLVYGVEGGEMHSVSIARLLILGWLFLYLGAQPFFPVVVRRRLSQVVSAMPARIVGAVRDRW